MMSLIIVWGAMSVRKVLGYIFISNAYFLTNSQRKDNFVGGYFYSPYYGGHLEFQNGRH